MIFVSDSMTSDKISMLQIETIIINTSLIQIAEKSIPENFLKPTGSNSTSCNDDSSFDLSHEKSKENFMGKLPSKKYPPLQRDMKPYHFNSLNYLKDNSKK
jgi:hypothetical protein